MRVLAAGLVLLLAGGCTSLVRQGSDGFYPGGVTAERFAGDNEACRVQANDHLAYDQEVQGGTRYARTRVFNDTYGRCMRALGYRPRPYLRNLVPQ